MNAPRTRWDVIFLTTATGMVAAAYIGKVPPVLPAIRSELALDLVAGGWLVSLVAIAVGVVGSLAGLAADRLGHRRQVLIGLALLAIGAAIGAVAPGVVTLFASRTLEGIGFLAVVVAAPGLINQATSDQHRRMALGFWSIYMPTGVALSVLGSALLLEPIGWRGLWWVSAVFPLVFLLALAHCTKDLPQPPRTQTQWKDIAATARRAGPWLIAATFGAYTLQWSAMMVWLPSFLIEQKGYSAFASAALTSLALISGLPGNLTGSWLLHHRVSRAWLIGGTLIATGLTAYGAFSSVLPDGLRYVLVLVFAAVGGILPAAVLGSAPFHAASPRQVGLVNGMLVQGSGTGQLLGPPLLAYVVTLGGWDSAGFLMIGATVGGAALAALVNRAERHIPKT